MSAVDFPTVTAKAASREGWGIALFLAVLLSVPALALVQAFVMICRAFGTWQPWWLRVHEDGVHTLIGTIFYVEHATRELPIDLLLGVSVGASMAMGLRLRRSAPGLAVWGGIAAAVTAVILVGTLFMVGGAMTWANLIQSHTRPGVALIAGSHWFYHLLCRPTLMLAGLSVALAFCAMTGQVRRRALLVVLAVFGLFAVISVSIPAARIFAGLAFTDPVFLGHQARELLTHGSVTLPLCLALCLWLADWPPGGLQRPGLFVGAGAVMVAAFGVTEFVGIATLAGGSLSMGQSDDLRILIGPHFFEHTLTYIVSPATAGAAFALLARKG